MVGKKKRVVRRKSARAKSSVSSKKVGFSRLKFGIVTRNFIMFVLLTAISWILYRVTGGASGGGWAYVFNFLRIVFAFISVALLIALLVLLLLKLIKK